ncbi:NAD(P)H-binding protein [Hymenobacter edaphi]|uniref:NAD-dependent dehydratase n=1 Tax=Hymenobacter edaphi TaxID=2211146 RepID=A0A328BSP7_9BACT|nr:NAD(P)H-binding protein [Hymenobacter edaphi]RAK68108.1 NAD-dependent dehydratase [Hymenobacter edaphi]
MKNVLVLGAGGNIARLVTAQLAPRAGVRLTLLARSARRLGPPPAGARVVEGSVLDYEVLKAAVAGQDLVYANRAGDLEAMARNIVRAMQETGVRRLIFISSIGICDEPLNPGLRPYRRAADALEASDLEYTILRPTWFSSADEVDYETTQKGPPEQGSVISQRSLAAFITRLIEAPEQYRRAKLGIHKPGS